MRVRLGMMIVTALLATPVASQAQVPASGTKRANDDGGVASGPSDGSSVGIMRATADLANAVGGHQDSRVG